jgi:hypothetical protein
MGVAQTIYLSGVLDGEIDNGRYISQWATPANGPLVYLMSILDSQILNLLFEIAIKYGDGSLAEVTGQCLNLMRSIIN